MSQLHNVFPLMICLFAFAFCTPPTQYSFPSFQGEVVKHFGNEVSHFGYIYSDKSNQRLRYDMTANKGHTVSIFDFKQNTSYVLFFYSDFEIGSCQYGPIYENTPNYFTTNLIDGAKYQGLVHIYDSDQFLIGRNYSNANFLPLYGFPKYHLVFDPYTQLPISADPLDYDEHWVGFHFVFKNLRSLDMGLADKVFNWRELVGEIKCWGFNSRK